MPLSQEFHDRAQQLLARYPVKRSALLMVLHDAQDDAGFLSPEVIREVASVMGLTAADVAGVATFYTMYKLSHPGRCLISLCTNVSCVIKGADEAAARLTELVGPEGQTTADGLMSWEQVECLAYCSAAPAAQVNYRDVPHLTADRVETLCSQLRAGRSVDEVLQAMRTEEAAGA
ncbi:MAG TPA: NAD(P)H-dependent oxidoreductase subunit E [Actinomycetota bacterium]|nr:NAD(P)H-dependent oxidoreductase subunit E [Actinomycetota bacterium]